MISECCECDKVAVRYWGLYAYCKAHLTEAANSNPFGHCCPDCNQVQPAHVSWRGESCGECRKRAGQHQVDENEREEWKAAAYQLLISVANDAADDFTADDLRHAAQISELEEPHHANCWGSVFSNVARAGLIEQTGEYRESIFPSRHKNKNAVWRRKL